MTSLLCHAFGLAAWIARAGAAPSYDILPFHAYPETWEHTTVEKYLDTQYYDYFVPHNKLL